MLGVQMNICHQIIEHQTPQIQARKIVKNSRKRLKGQGPKSSKRNGWLIQPKGLFYIILFLTEHPDLKIITLG